MKVLIVANYNTGKFSPFVIEQVDALRSLGVIIDFYGIVGKGAMGYLKNRKSLLKKINEFHPDIVHAHYGLSGLLANLQRKVPVITTFHGGDIDESKNLALSRICMILSVYSIFVSEKNINTARIKRNYSLIPCGVNSDLFVQSDKFIARKALGLLENKTYVLFSGAFDNKDKNYPLAQKAISLLPEYILLELKGYTRQQVALLMNAVDVSLLTSFAEGSPQFIKEAMACNCPIVSVPVGDVETVISNVEGCYLSSFEVEDIAAKITEAIKLNKRTEGRRKIETLALDGKSVAENVLAIYNSILKNRL